jgi:hypothetical protein
MSRDAIGGRRALSARPGTLRVLRLVMESLLKRLKGGPNLPRIVPIGFALVDRECA